MTALHELDPHVDGGFRAVVETPRGARAKLRYEPELGVFVLRRELVLGVSYPFDWGFIPRTKAPDGDPLDVMILHDSPTAPGVVIACRAIGAVKVTQKREHDGEKRERNDRLIAVPLGQERYDDVRDLPKRMREELEQFFVTAVLFEQKGVKIEGWASPHAAEKLLKEALAQA